MNRKERRFSDVLFVGGPLDKRVIRVEAKRVSYDCALIPERFDADLNPVVGQNPAPWKVRYVIRTLRGRLNSWRVAWLAAEGECGYDRAICAVLRHFCQVESYCGEGEVTEGETQEIEK